MPAPSAGTLDSQAVGKLAMCDEDDTLFRYVFNDLDAGELAAFERRLREDPELAQRLEDFRDCLAAQEAEAKESIAPVEMPRKLADRTAHQVLTRPATDQIDSACVGRKRFSLVETVTVGVCALVIGMITVPAIQSARESSRRAQCANHLKTIHQTGLAQYAARHNNYFPQIEPDENAGMFAVKLADSGSIERDTLQKALLCPSSNLATQVAEKRAAVVVPTRYELGIANAYVFDRLIRFMAGSYAYRFGHMRENGTYGSDPSTMSCRVALMADAPQRGPDGMILSRNHGACGQNVLFEDGSVDFVGGCWSPCLDHLFLNDDDKVAAGRGPQDAVLAPSEATPGPTRIVRVRVFVQP